MQACLGDIPNLGLAAELGFKTLAPHSTHKANGTERTWAPRDLTDAQATPHLPSPTSLPPPSSPSLYARGGVRRRTGATSSARFLMAAIALSPFLLQLNPAIRMQALRCGTFTAIGYISQSIAVQLVESAVCPV